MSKPNVRIGMSDQFLGVSRLGSSCQDVVSHGSE
jgi:hypothetical protein